MFSDFLNLFYFAVTRLPLKLSEDEVEMQKLVDRELYDTEDFRECPKCRPAAKTKFVKTVHVMTSPKVSFGICTCIEDHDLYKDWESLNRTVV